MKKIPLKKIKLGLMLLVGLLAIAVLLPATVIGRPKARPVAQSGGGSLEGICTEGTDFQFEANTGHIQTPDGNSIFMWSYNIAGDGFQSPGPILCVDEGDSVSIQLTNNLPVATSIVFPGQAFPTTVTAVGGTPGLFTTEAPPGGTVTYFLDNLQPGTYLYESGTTPHMQVQMGLYGALIVRPALGDNFAYNDADTEFFEEFILLLHEVDPDLHRQVERGEPFQITQRRDRYWFVNGRSFPDNSDDTGVPWFPYQPYGALVSVEAVDPNGINADRPPILVRYANPGSVIHPFHPHGNHMRVIAKDGRQLTSSFENFNTTVGAGQAYDLLWQWRDVEGWQPAGPEIPATIPGLIPRLLNLVHKDDATFYSGDPYLGFQGEFVPGIVVDNECGEFYFPWHSHALQEVQNFDEGFGGMLAIVAVLPPGGCP